MMAAVVLRHHSRTLWMLTVGGGAIVTESTPIDLTKDMVRCPPLPPAVRGLLPSGGPQAGPS
jgi:hypothetical protein